MTASGLSLCTHHYFGTDGPCDNSYRGKRKPEKRMRMKQEREKEVKISKRKMSAKLLLVSGKEDDKKKAARLITQTDSSELLPIYSCIERLRGQTN